MPTVGSADAREPFMCAALAKLENAFSTDPRSIGTTACQFTSRLTGKKGPLTYFCLGEVAPRPPDDTDSP